MAKNKRHRALREMVDPDKRYTLDEGVALVKKSGTAKFDETVDIAIRLGVDPRKVDQRVRTAISLPHGVGKSVIVAVFAEGDAARAALAAGADFVGSDDLVEKIQGGWTDFDKAISVRSLMAKVGRLGRVLGPRGLMPNPKTGTVIGPEDVARVVREVKGGRIDFQTEKAGIIHTMVGKSSFEEIKLRENILALMEEIVKLKPSSAKGTYIRSITLSTTMGVAIRLDGPEVIKATADLRG